MIVIKRVRVKQSGMVLIDATPTMLAALHQHRFGQAAPSSWWSWSCDASTEFSLEFGTDPPPSWREIIALSLDRLGARRLAALIGGVR